MGLRGIGVRVGAREVEQCENLGSQVKSGDSWPRSSDVCGCNLAPALRPSFSRLSRLSESSGAFSAGLGAKLAARNPVAWRLIGPIGPIDSTEERILLSVQSRPR